MLDDDEVCENVRHRGGLLTQIVFTFAVCLKACQMTELVQRDKELSDCLTSSSNRRALFVTTLLSTYYLAYGGE